MGNKIHIGPEWSEGRYVTSHSNQKFGVRVRILKLNFGFQIVIGFFDFYTDKFLWEEAVCDGIVLAKRKVDLADLEADLFLTNIFNS